MAGRSDQGVGGAGCFPVGRGTLNLIGDILKSLQRPADAVPAHMKALALLTEIARADPANENYQYNVANTCQLIGDAYLAIARLNEFRSGRTHAWIDARQWYRRSAEAFDGLRRRGALTEPFAVDAKKVADALELIGRELSGGARQES